MNIIVDRVNTPYLFHMEDDWKYVNKQKYITECLEILQIKEVGQVLINFNYSETGDDWNIMGGEYKTVIPSCSDFYIHEYYPPEEMHKFVKKYGNGVKNCAYWPHFSFRPSLVKTSVFKKIGKFSETVSHFEMDYAYKYIKEGYVSVFLDNINCLHTGRLTSERFTNEKLNAYQLNNISQFDNNQQDITEESGEGSSESSESNSEHSNSITQLYQPQTEKDTVKFESFLINLDCRKDRLEKMKESERT